MRQEGHRDNRGGGVPRPHPHAAADTVEVQRVERDGVSQGEEQPYDIRQVCESEVPLRQQGVLVPWVLRRHRGTEQGGGGAVHKEPAGGGQGKRVAGDERAVRPVHG